jgi:hypothetical protein
MDGKEYGTKEGKRLTYEEDEEKEERNLGMKIRNKSFPVEFQWAFPTSNNT